MYSVAGSDGSLVPVLANSKRCGRAPAAMSLCQRSDAKNRTYSA